MSFKDIIETRALGDVITEVNPATQIIANPKDYGMLSNFTLYSTEYGSSNPFEVVVGSDMPSSSVATIGGEPAEAIEPSDSPGGIGKLRTVEFNPKRVAATFSVSQQVLNDDKLNLEAYIQQLAIERLTKVMELQVFALGTATGTEGNKFQNIGKDVMVPQDLVVTNAGVASIKEMTKIRNAVLFPNKNINDLFWVINTGQVMDIADTAGRSTYEYYKEAPKGAFAHLFGRPCYSPNGSFATDFSGKSIIAVAMTKEGYGFAMSDVVVRKIANDTQNGLAGTVTFIADCWADGKILNYSAIKLAAKSTASTANVTDVEEVANPVEMASVEVQSIEVAAVEEKPKAKRKSNKK